MFTDQFAHWYQSLMGQSSIYAETASLGSLKGIFKIFEATLQLNTCPFNY